MYYCFVIYTTRPVLITNIFKTQEGQGLQIEFLYLLAAEFPASQIRRMQTKFTILLPLLQVSLGFFRYKPVLLARLSLTDIPQTGHVAIHVIGVYSFITYRSHITNGRR